MYRTIEEIRQMQIGNTLLESDHIQKQDRRVCVRWAIKIRKSAGS